MANIITVEELKNTVLNANIDTEYIQPAIYEAQDVYLREILGDALYDSIQNKINSQSLAGKYLTLVNNYIKPYLTYKVQSIMCVPLNYKMRNAGIINQYDQGFNTSNVKDTAYLADYYNGKAEFYANRLMEYLQKNAADIVEYRISDENITNPTTTQTACTIYLGGAKRRSTGINISGGSSRPTTVDWNDITNKPDFATVATTGDYNDLINKPTPTEATDGYFYVENRAEGVENRLTFDRVDTAPCFEIFVSTDQSHWRTLGITNGTYNISIPFTDRLYIKVNAIKWCGDNPSKCIILKCTGDFAVGGNIMSLLNGGQFENTVLDSYNTYAFTKLFYQSTYLVDASALVLPTTTTDYCYYGMFDGCTSLTAAPILPATTTTDYCYYYMFYGCTGLTAVPDLPAADLAPYCYCCMFKNCTSLTTAPALPATTLAETCYKEMFSGCTSLTSAPELPATTLADHCYSYMFNNCSSLTSAPELPATTLGVGCYSYMFRKCTALTTAPILPATTLVKNCYYDMFYGCTALTTAPTLPATTLAETCYKEMFSGCTNLNAVTTYANDISATNCTQYWLQNVAATGDFYNLGGATYTSGISGIPSGWTEHTSI